MEVSKEVLKERVERDLEFAERKLELVKAKIRAEVEVFLMALKLDFDTEVEESFKRLGELVGLGVFKHASRSVLSYLSLKETIEKLRRALEEGHF